MKSKLKKSLMIKLKIKMNETTTHFEGAITPHNLNIHRPR